MIVLITGAGGGLGRALSVECAKRGYDLFLTDRDPGCLERLRSGILRQYDVDIKTMACDLTAPDMIADMLHSIDDKKISFGMLLNVAGVDFEGSFMDRDCESIAGIIKLNIEATLRITHNVIKRRTPDKKFYVVFVSSLASMYPIPLKATYAASKRFLLDFAFALGCELQRENINVLSLCPGGLATTKEAISGIISQGFWGNATTNRLESVARKTIESVLKGRRVYIPGALNRVFSVLGQIVPRVFISRLLYRRWNSAQQQWLKIS